MFPDPVRVAYADPRSDPDTLDPMRRLPTAPLARNPRAAGLEGRTVTPCLMSAEPVSYTPRKETPHERN